MLSRKCKYKFSLTAAKANTKFDKPFTDVY